MKQKISAVLCCSEFFFFAIPLTIPKFTVYTKFKYNVTFLTKSLACFTIHFCFLVVFSVCTF